MLWMKVVNDGSGTLQVGNYTYSVFVNEQKLTDGKITGYKRVRGWKTLLRKAVKEATGLK